MDRGTIQMNDCEKVEVESDRCKDDYAGEEARRKRVMEEVAKVEMEDGGSTKVILIEIYSTKVIITNICSTKVILTKICSTIGDPHHRLSLFHINQGALH